MSWITPRPVEHHMEFMREMSLVLADLGSGPLCKLLNELMQAGKFREVVEFEFDYEKGYTRNDYLYARQIAALVEKQEFLDLGYDKEKAALLAFIAAEKKCEQTNERLAFPCPEGDVSAVLHYAMRKIEEVLGDRPALESLDFFFGPGATTNVKGSVANARRKLSTRMACSEELLPSVGELLAEFPMWVDAEALSASDGLNTVPVDITPGKLHFVPKNSKTFRPICVEPVLNSLYQKGIGSYLKGRLRKFGVNLFDQTRNQELARIGSEEGNLCTIDLKSASDTVSIGLVFHLLPFEWASWLSDCRTGHVEYRGITAELHKFSSMGNGYTFELESLLFFGLASGVVSYMRQTGEIAQNAKPIIGVYGDDLIIPTGGFELMRRVLSFCGFDMNLKKSFCTGPFRESCGADYFLGSDIRPFFLRKELSDQVLFSFHNWAMRRGERRIAALCLRWTRRRHRIFGPDGYGDGHLLGSYSLRVPRRIRRCGWEGGYFSTFALSPKRDLTPLKNDILFPAYSAYCRMSVEGPCNPFVIRGNRGCTKISVYTRSRGIFFS